MDVYLMRMVPEITLKKEEEKTFTWHLARMIGLYPHKIAHHDDGIEVKIEAREKGLNDLWEGFKMWVRTHKENEGLKVRVKVEVL